MISFCNLPIAEFADYGIKYGGYSIGMSRKWGIKNHFNPVIYCESTSNIIRLLSKIIIDLQRDKDKNRLFDILECFAYIKPIEDTLEIGRKKYENYRFMDEREVRLVPNLKELSNRGISPILDVEGYSKYKYANNNKSLIPHSIPFEWSDIKYIIVKNLSNIIEYQQLLKDLGCNNGNIQIFSHEQVNEDFIGIGHNKLSKNSLPPNSDLEKLMKLLILLGQKSSIDNHRLFDK